MVLSESAIWLKLMILNIVLQICLQIMFVSAQSRYSKVVLHYTLQQTADRWINVSLFLLACVDSLQLMNFYFMHRTRFFQRYLLGGGGYNRPQYLFVKTYVYSIYRKLYMYVRYILCWCMQKYKHQIRLKFEPFEKNICVYAITLLTLTWSEQGIRFNRVNVYRIDDALQAYVKDEHCMICSSERSVYK